MSNIELKETEHPLVSVIIPIYNIEKYVGKCLTSIINQKYNNLEIILIDDGSTDGSSDICKEYKSCDKRIRYYRQDNRGVSSARNKGLDISNGEYILFVDGDDFLEIEAIHMLVSMMQDNRADCVIFEHIVDRENTSMLKIHQDEIYNKIITKEKAIELTISYKSRFVWSKLFKKDKIVNLRFDETVFRGEDTLFAVEALEYCETIYYTDYAPYHYLQSENSAVRSRFNYKKLTVMDAFEKICSLCKKKYPDLLNVAIDSYISETIAVAYEMYVSKIPMRKIRGVLSRSADYLKTESMSMSNTIRLMLFVHLPGFIFSIKRLNHKRLGII